MHPVGQEEVEGEITGKRRPQVLHEFAQHITHVRVGGFRLGLGGGGRGRGGEGRGGEGRGGEGRG